MSQHAYQRHLPPVLLFQAKLYVLLDNNSYSFSSLACLCMGSMFSHRAQPLYFKGLGIGKARLDLSLIANAGLSDRPAFWYTGWLQRAPDWLTSFFYSTCFNWTLDCVWPCQLRKECYTGEWKYYFSGIQAMLLFLSDLSSSVTCLLPFSIFYWCKQRCGIQYSAEVACLLVKVHLHSFWHLFFVKYAVCVFTYTSFVK